MDALSQKKLNKISRIDNVVGEYFAAHPSITDVLAKDLMKLFIQQGFFVKDYNNGHPIHSLLRQLKKLDKLHLFKHCKAICSKNYSWSFARL